jgi:hypothetical protein
LARYGTHTITVVGVDGKKRTESFSTERSIMTIQVNLRSTGTEINVYPGERIYI